ncbi:hypothetical protein ABTE87_22330, partial [Acinetobacter baumannii]
SADVDHKLDLLVDKTQSPEVRDKALDDLWEMRGYFDQDKVQFVADLKIARMENPELSSEQRDKEASDLQDVLDSLNEK